MEKSGKVGHTFRFFRQISIEAEISYREIVVRAAY